MIGKEQRDVEDILKVFKRTDPEKIPLFVAHDLNKLPPITFDHVDVTRLLRDLLLLKSEIDNIKENYVTKEQWAQTKTDASSLRLPNDDSSSEKNLSVLGHNAHNKVKRSSDTFVNKNRRGGFVHEQSYNCDSGPFGMLHIPSIYSRSSTPESAADNGNASHCVTGSKLSLSNTADARMQPTVSHMAHTNLTEHHNTEIRSPPSAARESDTSHSLAHTEMPIVKRQGCTADDNRAPASIRQNNNNNTSTLGSAGGKSYPKEGVKDTCTEVKETYSNVVRHNNKGKKLARTSIMDKAWVQKQEYRIRNRIIGRQGTAEPDPNCKFRAADIRVPLFVYNVDKNVSSRDIEDYVQTKTRVKVTAEQVYVKAEKMYNAYKILVPNHKLQTFLDDNMWPEGISFRRYIEFKNVNNCNTQVTRDNVNGKYK
ncbi:uncharacterized protein LOC134668602 [Cydia fagiglandana]|uniref:uncharacterized protein LOC134668602 n=1 Tax=Cydia fagiglandana TaxID=1458189 RepID=UPI002FEE2EAE